MTKGIKGLQKQELRKVAEDIKTYDGGGTIDGLICKTGTAKSSWADLADSSSDSGDNSANVLSGAKCPSNNTVGSTLGLEKLVSAANDTTPSKFTDNEKMGVLPNTSKNISKDISKLNREQHRIVSSAFAKAHEGAEIVEIRSISTTSVMVNACYDVLAEGLPVSPYRCSAHT